MPAESSRPLRGGRARGALRAGLKIVPGCGAVWLIYLLKGSAWGRLYPVAMTGFALACFALSLRGVPLAERFARRSGAELDAAGVRYCRGVTVAWVVFLSAHLAAAVATLFLPFSVWAWYNGCAAYVLMGCMFAGEAVVRRRRAGNGRGR